MSRQGPLTSWLLSATPEAFKRATTHPFLAAAGKGTLPKTTLSQWLSQDRLYAQGYIRFIGLLLTKIRLQTPTRERGSSSEAAASDILIDALVNIRTELRFFEATARDYGLDLTAISAEAGGTGSGACITTSAGISTTGSASCPGSAGIARESKTAPSAETDMEDEAPGQSDSQTPHQLCSTQGECQMPSGAEVCYPPSPQHAQSQNPADIPACEPCKPSGGHPSSTGPVERGGPVYFSATRITRAYIDMFMSSGSSGVSLIEGLAVLWATEVCYLRAWKYAASFLEQRGGEAKDDTDGGALREKFIPNWSSPEFEAFVDRIGDLLDEMAGQIKGVEEEEAMRGRCLEWWRQVVWLEERFWPQMD